MPGVGIIDVATFLPNHRRTNSYWKQSLVDGWLARSRLSGAEESATNLHQAVKRYSSDPFQGVLERRVIDAAMQPSDMEATALSLLIEALGVRAQSIDLLLSYSLVPDYLCMNSASVVHYKAKLRADAPAFGVDAVCASLVPQFLVAEKFIRSGSAKLVVSTQSAASSRILPVEQPYSVILGDGASSVMFGEVPDGYGLLATASTTRGEHHAGFVASCERGPWWGDARIVATNADRVAARWMRENTPAVAERLVGEVLAKAGVAASDVSVFFCHQPSAWLGEVIQERTGMCNSARPSTFSWTANVSATNIPLQIQLAKSEGLLKRGDHVVLFTMGSGMYCSAAAVRWF